MARELSSVLWGVGWGQWEGGSGERGCMCALCACSWSTTAVQQKLAQHFKAKYTPNLAKEMATHFSILAWRIPWTEEPGGLQCPGSKKSRTRLKWLNNNNILQLKKKLNHIVYDLWRLVLPPPPPTEHKALEKLYLSKVNSFLLLGYILLYEFMRVWYGIFESLFYIYESLFKHAPVDKTFGLFPILDNYK